MLYIIAKIIFGILITLAGIISLIPEKEIIPETKAIDSNELGTRINVFPIILRIGSVVGVVITVTSVFDLIKSCS